MQPQILVMSYGFGIEISSDYPACLSSAIKRLKMRSVDGADLFHGSVLIPSTADPRDVSEVQKWRGCENEMRSLAVS